MVSIHVITAYVFIHYKPHYRYYASHNKYPPLKTHQIFTNKVQQYIIHHNARDKPSTGTSNNLSNVHVICKTIEREYRLSKYTGVYSINTPLIPIVESVYSAKKQCVSRTKHE